VCLLSLLLVIENGIKLSIVLVTASVICVMGAITGRVVHLVPRLVEFDHKLELLPLVGRAHAINCVNSTTSNSILGNQLRAVKQLHTRYIVRNKVKLSRARNSIKVIVKKDPMDRVNRFEVHANVQCARDRLGREKLDRS
jgi:hypothetical protein